MSPYRRQMGASMLFVISAGLTAWWNDFIGMSRDFGANLFLAGFATVALSLCLHLFVVRRLLSRTSLPCQLMGVAASGVASFVIYDVLRGHTEHFTYLQRLGSSVNWGDEGRSVGLGRHAFGFRWPTFFSHLPNTLFSACLFGIVWFPCLVWLERWSYGDARLTAASENREKPAA